MSIQNSDVRTVIQTGTRRVGFGLRPAWFREVGVGKGDTVGIQHLDDGELEILLVDYDATSVDATVPVTATGGSLTLDLDRASRHVLGEELGASLYARRADRRRIRVMASL